LCDIVLSKKWSFSKLLKALLPGWIVSGIFFYWVIPILFSLKENGNLYFGGSNGFWQDTVTSLTHNLAYNAIWAGPLEILLRIIAISTFLIVPFWLIAKKKLMNEDPWKKLFAVYILLSLMISSTILQPYYFGTLYLIDRNCASFSASISNTIGDIVNQYESNNFSKNTNGIIVYSFRF
jgi:hypothetical protein